MILDQFRLTGFPSASGHMSSTATYRGVPPLTANGPMPYVEMNLHKKQGIHPRFCRPAGTRPLVSGMSGRLQAGHDKRKQRKRGQGFLTGLYSTACRVVDGLQFSGALTQTPARHRHGAGCRLAPLQKKRGCYLLHTWYHASTRHLQGGHTSRVQKGIVTWSGQGCRSAGQTRWYKPETEQTLRAAAKPDLT